MTPRKILVLRGGALGDFVVTLPALAALRRAYPEAYIELIGNATAAALAVNRGLLACAHSQHEARWAALYESRPLSPDLQSRLGEFDLILNYWPDDDGVLADHFPVRPGQQFLSAPSMPTRAPAAAHFAGALASLGIQPIDFWYLRESDITVDDRRRGPIAIHPGSGSRQKNWPDHRWMKLIAELSEPVVLIVGEAEAETWSRERLAKSPLAARLTDGSLKVAQQLTLERLVDTFAGCRLFLGHDSGVSHVAAACGTPCVLLFGPTDPAMWAPPAPHVRVIRRGETLSAITVGDVLSALP